ncbi:MAG: Hpt domain-containing protein, partial [Planctomycetota bacterium]|nr:Hpt domain-containing protein [Planctomycetota bacterium]
PETRPPERKGGKSLAAKAEGVAGLEARAALEMLGGNADLYGKLLALARDDLAKIMGNLDNGLANGDWSRLRIETHGVKSALASIGAAELSKAAADLEGALARGDTEWYRAHIAGFKDGLGALERELSSILRADGKTDARNSNVRKS